MEGLDNVKQIVLVDDFTTATVGQDSLSGTNLELKITFNNARQTSQVDNIVPGTATVPLAPTIHR